MNRISLIAAVLCACAGTALGGYTLEITGVCPGQITLEWSGAEPYRQQAFLVSREEGNWKIPDGPCAGTVLGLDPQFLYFARLYGTGDGSGAVNVNMGVGRCGIYIQLVEVGTCRTSNVARTP